MTQNHITRPAADELLELVQTRLGMTEGAAREYIFHIRRGERWQKMAGRPGSGASVQVNGVDELHSMPDLIVARIKGKMQR